MLEVTWKELVEHKGAPFRVALTYESDVHYDEFVLLDHIPHNDEGGILEGSEYFFPLLLHCVSHYLKHFVLAKPARANCIGSRWKFLILTVPSALCS